jgi:hypothetical protein
MAISEVQMVIRLEDEDCAFPLHGVDVFDAVPVAAIRTGKDVMFRCQVSVVRNDGDSFLP